MKPAIIVICFTAVLGWMTACSNSGSSSGNTSQTRPSGIKTRAFVTNSFRNEIEIVNAASDTIGTIVGTDSSGNTITAVADKISAGTSPTRMALTPDKKLTAVFARASNVIGIISNDLEAVSGSFLLPDYTDSFVAAPDNKTLYIAVPNAPVSGQPSGVVDVLDLTTSKLTDTIPVPRAHRIVLSHDGNRLLVFADNTDQMWVVDTAAKTATAVSGFDRPVYGVFGSDDTKAFILSCGKECGGMTANIAVLDLASNTAGASVPVSAATVGLLDSAGNLYVAGTAESGTGVLTVVNTGNLTVSTPEVTISDGYHDLMALTSDGKLFIGARACTGTAAGCLSIYDTAAMSAVTSAAGGGDVTGIQPISDRNVVYVIEGGELVIYDTTTDQPQAKQIDIVGRASDVKLVD